MLFGFNLSTPIVDLGAPFPLYFAQNTASSELKNDLAIAGNDGVNTNVYTYPQTGPNRLQDAPVLDVQTGMCFSSKSLLVSCPFQ